jgi:predicted cytidylate kinase
MIITLSGTPGSGKSTVGRLLAQRLEIPFFGMGTLRRRFAAEQGITLAELNKREEVTPYSDIVVDQYQAKLPEEYPSFVLDGYVSYYFVPQAVKIYLTVDIREGAARILAQHRDVEHWNTIEEGVTSLKAREQSNKLRFGKLYNTDPTDLKHYDFILDTTGKTPEQTIEEILRYLRQKHLLQNEKHL